MQTDNHTILVGDIGGTKITLALVEVRSHKPHIKVQHTYSCSEEQNFSAFLHKFRQQVPHEPYAACIGGAGPVTGDKIVITNLPWEVKRTTLTECGYAHAFLINDLVAHASTLPYLNDKDLHVLQPGTKQEGAYGLIAAGTGLGEAFVLQDQQRYFVTPSEGGHCDYSPSNDTELDLLRTLLKKHDHVSWERLVSGKYGFVNIAQFLRTKDGPRPDKELEAAMATDADIGVLIHQKAMAQDPFAGAVINLFLRLYGCEAGNLALKGLTLGGLFVGGGIIKQLLPFVEKSDFLLSFQQKGRFKALMQSIPVKIILDADNALKGAAYHALAKLQSLAP